MLLSMSVIMTLIIDMHSLVGAETLTNHSVDLLPGDNVNVEDRLNQPQIYV